MLSVIHFAEGQDLFVVMMSVIMLNAVMLSVVAPISKLTWLAASHLS